LRVVRGKNPITYKGKPMKITTDFSTETLKAKREYSEEFQALKENARILHPAKISFKIEEEIKIFHGKQK
jgi:hypothetical protein